MGGRVILDLFCGAGSAAKGYADAGFNIIGVDKEPQKRYPFKFIKEEVFFFMQNCFLSHEFDAIHASPPCQKYSKATKEKYKNNHPDYIPELRKILNNTGLSYMIENVPQAPLIPEKTIVLCGTMFDLGVFRHRKFETNFNLMAPSHKKHNGKIGDGKYFSVAGGAGRWKSWGKVHRKISKGTADEWRQAMGIDWMTRKELTQAIPLAYTEFIGKQLKEVLDQ